MAVDAFLKIDGIKGESADHKHKGEIDVITFGWGVLQDGSHAFGGGGGSGKAQFQDLHITKKIDSASPLLMVGCATGQHFKEALLVIRKAGGDQMEYVRLRLSDLLISAVIPHGASGANGDEIPNEEISLNFARIELLYQPQGADGRPQGGPIMGGWDLKANRKV